MIIVVPTIPIILVTYWMRQLRDVEAEAPLATLFTWDGHVTGHVGWAGRERARSKLKRAKQENVGII